MPRGLDHIVHAVHDLDAAVALYRDLGFQVGARNVHPRQWGTQNHIIQFPGTYVELLALADTADIAPHSSRQFSFGAFNRDFLAKRQGLSMFVLQGRGASDTDAFRRGGISNFDLYSFEREAKRPDGTTVKVAFELAFASDPLAPDIGFFTSHHLHPENFWNPAFQKHRNSALNVAGIVLVAEEPDRHRKFLTAFTDAVGTSKADGFIFRTPRGEIEIMAPEGFTHCFGVAAPDTGQGARVAAIRFALADASLLEAAPEQAGIAGLYSENATIIGAEDAMGAVLIFEPAGGSPVDHGA